MAKVTKEMALRYHEDGRPGKIEITPTKPYQSQLDLSLAYSPGVAFPCLEIEKDPADVYRYTNKGNLVAVISNGTAVLGLGDIGAMAGKPVMEGKALLFKIFAGLDAFDIEVNEKDPEKFIEAVKAIAPTFGGINLEDIKAPECFEIERRLKEECDIPVMHDDQHGTAIISAAGLINALDIQGKKIEDIKLVVNGAGAAAMSCTALYVELGVRPENVVMCDSKGVIRKDRKNLSAEKSRYATTRNIFTLADAMNGADVFLGLSVKDVVTPDMVKSMAPKPIVFALANPDPEIAYDVAVASRPDLIFATGRSDYPNQVNNVIGFPYIFRGALDCGATTINEDMKVAAAKAIAEIAKEPVPSIVDEAYGLVDLHFGREYILPKPIDPRLLVRVAPAVAEAADKSGVAKRPIKDMEAYREHLSELMGGNGKMMRHISDLARKNPQRVVFSEVATPNVLEAALQLYGDGICKPVLLGDPYSIRKMADIAGYSLEGIEIIDPRSDKEEERRDRYAADLSRKLWRQGVARTEARALIEHCDYFGLMMVEHGDANAMVSTVYSADDEAMERARKVVGFREGYNHFATMHILNTRKGTYFLADTAVNARADEEALVDITRLVAEKVEFFSRKPVIAMLSYSNFGSDRGGEASDVVAGAVRRLHTDFPDICVDGEMQVMMALDTDLRDKVYPLSKLYDKKVNTLVFPNLCAANTAYQMILSMGVGSAIGPVQMGLRKPVHFVNINESVRNIVNVATIASFEASLADK